MADPKQQTDDTVIRVRDIVTRFGRQTVHDGVGFNVRRGELLAVIGGSGSGKSVLLREIVGLQAPTSGSVELLGADVARAGGAVLSGLRRRVGMLFQDGALFSSMDVRGNVAVPLREHTRLGSALIDEVVGLRLALAGLPPETASKMPSELSGGMRKRAALARALALEPEVLFLDEPTSGLDPVTARAFDRLLVSLNRDLGLTVLLITHDLDTLLGVVDRVVVIGGGKVVVDGPLERVRAHPDPWIQSYFAARPTNPSDPLPVDSASPAPAGARN
jgi:phospholipid/cholesterol/gamma-HCH transport system ATP-binding protein